MNVCRNTAKSFQLNVNSTKTLKNSDTHQLNRHSFIKLSKQKVATYYLLSTEDAIF